MPEPRRRPTQADFRRRRLIAGGAVLAAAIAVGVVLAGSFGVGEPNALTVPAEEKGAEPAPSTQAAASPPSGPAAPQQAASGAPVDTSGWKAAADPVPILMYHDVEAPAADAPLPELHVPEEDFREQMKWLADEGYTGVTMKQVADAWYDDGLLPKKPVVITFDDGFKSHHKVAMPALQKLGWPGVLMLQSFAPKGLPDDAPITPSQVEDLLAVGWELGSHTITHADLTTVSAEQLASEVEKSKRGLERQFGVEIDHLCYPAGQFDDNVVAATEKAGYTTASTVEPGLASRDEPLTLNRIRINGSDGLSGFIEHLQAAGA